MEVQLDYRYPVKELSVAMILTGGLLTIASWPMT